MSIVDRTTLKSYFQMGKFPTEQNFADFIESTVLQGETIAGSGDITAQNITVTSLLDSRVV